MAPRSSVLVTTQPRTASWIDDAVILGGGDLTGPESAQAVVWTKADDPEGLRTFLADHPRIEWVQLPWAGIDPYRGLVFDRRDLVWSCAKGVYSDPVAEHALALLLAGFRQLHSYSRAESWSGDVGRNLFGARVTILGGGGIGQVLVRLLGPFGCSITVVRHTPEPMDGVDRVLAEADLDDALTGADVLVLALPLLDATRGIIGARELALLAPGAWLINVARGEHVVTDDLMAALDGGHLGGAGLDVTDPEPLPDGHPLWSRPNVMVTPHTANTREMARPLLSGRITENVRRYLVGETLFGLVDPDLGY